MRLLRYAIIVAAMALASPALAQTNQGTSPLTVAKGGTGQATVLGALQTWGLQIPNLTHKGAPLTTDKLMFYDATGTAAVYATLGEFFSSGISLGAAKASSLALNGATLGGNAFAVVGSSFLNGAIVSQSSSTLAGCISADGSHCILQVDTSTASAVAGVDIKGDVAGGTVNISAIDSSATTALAINAKGAGAISIGNSSTGAVRIGNGGGGLTLLSALTYGGVTLNNAVTGTGNMVLSTSPTFTTPNLGTPSAVNLSNATALPLGSITGFGTNVASLLGSAASGTGGVAGTTSPTIATPNITTGFQIGGAAASGNYARGNGTNFVSSTIQPGDLPLASNAAIGGMRGDGSTISCSSGVCTATGSAATSVAAGTTTVTTTSANSLLGSGSVSGGNGTLSAVTAGAGISISPTQVSLSLNNAVLDGLPTNPTGTTNAGATMMGLGTTCKLTPVYSGRVRVTFHGNVTNTSNTGTTTNQIRYGTGTAPANAATTGIGTQVGANQTLTNSGGTPTIPFSNGGVITGLTVGQALWFDVALFTGGTAGSVGNVSCEIEEF